MATKLHKMDLLHMLNTLIAYACFHAVVKFLNRFTARVAAADKPQCTAGGNSRSNVPNNGGHKGKLMLPKTYLTPLLVEINFFLEEKYKLTISAFW